MNLVRCRSTVVAATILAAACLGAGPAHSGLVFTQKSTNSDPEAQGMNMTTRVSIDAGGAKVEFLDTASPLMPKGSYMLMRRDDDVMILVNPEAKTWSEFDLSAMLGAMKPMMQAMGQGPGGGEAPPLKPEKPVIEKLLEEDGGTILGRPTKHFKHRIRSSMVMTMAPGMSMTTTTDSIEDVWMAELPLEPKVVKALSRMNSSVVIPEEFSAFVEAQKALPQGLPMKRVTTSTSETTGTGMMAAMAKMANKGGNKPSTTTIEIVEISEESVPASAFQIPAGYTETELMSPGMAMPDMNRRQ